MWMVTAVTTAWLISLLVSVREKTSRGLNNQSLHPCVLSANRPPHYWDVDNQLQHSVTVSWSTEAGSFECNGRGDAL